MKTKSSVALMPTIWSQQLLNAYHRELVNSMKELDLFESRVALTDVINAGYCVVSRQHRILKRIDRADWFEYMNWTHFRGRLDRNEPGWEDHYRRCFSHDELVLPHLFDIRAVHNSGSVGDNERGFTGNNIDGRELLDKAAQTVGYALATTP